MLETALPAESASAGRARKLVVSHWQDLDADTLMDIELIVSELVTNAVQHGLPDIVLRLRRDAFAIDISVLDQGPALPHARSADPTVASGRGLSIIDQLAERWGCDELDGSAGKVVWATLNRA